MSASSRVLGLSKSQKPPPLLRRIGKKESGNKLKPVQLKIPKEIHDPPVSSDEEEDQHSTPKVQETSATAEFSTKRADVDALLDSSCSSDEERAARGGIQRTTFRGTTGKAKRKSDDEDLASSQDVENSATTAAATKRRRVDGRGATYGGSSSGGLSQTPASSAEHLQDERGFTKVRASKARYGKKNSSSQPRTGANDAERKPRPKPKLQVPEHLVSPEKPNSGKLRVPSSSPPPPSTKASLKLARGDSEQRAAVRSPPRRKIKTVNSIESLLSAKKNPPPRLRPKKRVEAARSPSPPPAVFKIPTSFSQFKVQAGDRGDGGLPEIGSDTDQSTGGAGDGVLATVVDAAAPVCPWCGGPVDKAALDDFSKGKRMNVRQQTRFCRKHKRQTALETWKTRRYPDLQWHALTERFAEHRDDLLGIVNGKASYYRSALADKIASGQARSMRREDNLNPGYYGPRGFNLMCDYLVGEFGGLLKARAVDDRVIAGRGSAAFIQAVLVAELAVRLVGDDMGVGEDEARRIVEESKAIGELVHEDQ